MVLIVELNDIAVSLGGQTVLSGVDLVLGPGATIGVVGPNGSGKTTLTRTLATLIPVERGSATILGETTDLNRVRSQIGLIGHQPTLIPELTLSENLEHVARLSGIDTSRVDKALGVVGLDAVAGRRAAACSFGMQRRVEIAHLLLRRPRLLLLDEAASGLDETAQELIGALIGTVTDREGAAVIVSHDKTHLTRLCDEVMTLEAGRLVAM